MASGSASPVRVVRIISRLAVGGSTIQAISLTKLLEPRYRSTLITGVEAAHEGDMRHLVRALGVTPVVIPSMQREVATADLRTIAAVARIIRRERPAILHTHAAKAGAVGRFAALLAGRARPPVIVHTFHGHVLEGYFSPTRSAVFRGLERLLARISTRLIAVSEEVKSDLVRLRIASPDRIEVIPLGFDLDRFAISGEDRRRLRRSFREELGIPLDRRVVTFVGRIVPIKRVDRFLAVANRLVKRDDVHFLIVGDGELRPQLEDSTAARSLGDKVTWAGFRLDLPAVYCASDVVALTSDNEGTPVSLIEAQATGLPVVSTDVGGARAVVEEGVSGRVFDRDDVPGMSSAIASILDDPKIAARYAEAGRASAMSRFTIARLVSDVDELYRRLLGETGTSE